MYKTCCVLLNHTLSNKRLFTQTIVLTFRQLYYSVGHVDGLGDADIDYNGNYLQLLQYFRENYCIFFYFPGVSTFGFYLQNTRWINDFLFPISRADVLSPHYSRRSARFSLWGRTRHPARHSEFHRSSARLSQQHLLISIFSDNGRGILPRKLFEILCILLRVFLLSATEI